MPFTALVVTFQMRGAINSVVLADMDRLQRIKARYDPDNFFCLNPNVVPAPAVAT